jgi:hypothetical protein
MQASFSASPRVPSMRPEGRISVPRGRPSSRFDPENRPSVRSAMPRQAPIRRSFRDDLPPGGRRPSRDIPGRESGFGPKASRFFSSGLPPPRASQPAFLAKGLRSVRGGGGSISLRFPSRASSGHDMNLHARIDSGKRILPVDNGDIGGGIRRHHDGNLRSDGPHGWVAAAAATHSNVAFAAGETWQ